MDSPAWNTCIFICIKQNPVSSSLREYFLRNLNISGAKPARLPLALPQMMVVTNTDLVSHLKTSRSLPHFSSSYSLTLVNSTLEMSPECHFLLFLPTGAHLPVFQEQFQPQSVILQRCFLQCHVCLRAQLLQTVSS